MMKETYRKRALALSYFTIAYNVFEGIVSIIVGWISGSISLIGFGMDSFIESMSGHIMIWRFSHKNLSEKKEKRIEEISIVLVSYSLFTLAMYVLYESVRKLLT